MHQFAPALLGFTPDWYAGSAAFLASLVEFVEAFTIVLVVGITINWRSSLMGALLATLILAVIVAIFGVTLVQFIPLALLRLVVGSILVLFGLKWLKKAILRYSGRKAFHDEEAIYEEEIAAIRARGEAVPATMNTFGVVTSLKSVLLEGLEVAFIVVTLGLKNNTTTTTLSLAQANALYSAIIGALAAGALVVILGTIVRAPLTRVPENTLKFVVGVMLVSFGTFWGGEGLGINWPGQDVVLLVLIALYLVTSFVLIQALRPSTQPSAISKGGQA